MSFFLYFRTIFLIQLYFFSYSTFGCSASLTSVQSDTTNQVSVSCPKYTTIYTSGTSPDTKTIYPESTSSESTSSESTSTESVTTSTQSQSSPVIVVSTVGTVTETTISGSIEYTTTIPAEGITSGTVEIVEPTAGTVTETITSGTLPFTTTLAQASGTVSGTVEVVSPENNPTTIYSGTVPTTETFSSSTVVVIPTAVCDGVRGLEYAVYDYTISSSKNEFCYPTNGQTDVFAFNEPAYFGSSDLNQSSPLFTGVFSSTDDIPEWASSWYLPPYPPQASDMASTYCACKVIVYQFFLRIPETDTYTLVVNNVDDVFFGWFGDKAISGWSNNNFDAYSYWHESPNMGLGTVGMGNFTVGNYSEGYFLPVRFVVANGAYIGGFDFYFTSDSTGPLATTSYSYTKTCTQQFLPFGQGNGGVNGPTEKLS